MEAVKGYKTLLAPGTPIPLSRLSGWTQRARAPQPKDLEVGLLRGLKSTPSWSLWTVPKGRETRKAWASFIRERGGGWVSFQVSPL